MTNTCHMCSTPITFSYILLIQTYSSEATSALDSEAEEAVQAALDDLMTQQSLTVVVVAHRLRTVRNADRIAVLENGTVVESGSHEELVQIENGIYKKMVERGTEILDET